MPERPHAEPLPLNARVEILAGIGALPDEALVDIAVVGALTDSGASTCWARLKSDPTHPRPIRLSARATRFRLGDVRSWLASKVAA